MARVKVQRRDRDRLSPDRRTRLEQLPGWVWHVQDALCDQAFALLAAYSEREGNALVPQDHVEAGYKLGQWVGVQRRDRERMDPARRARLDALPGWAWDKHDAKWGEAYQALRTYVEREGHARVPQSHVDGEQLRGWALSTVNR